MIADARASQRDAPAPPALELFPLGGNQLSTLLCRISYGEPDPLRKMSDWPPPRTLAADADGCSMVRPGGPTEYEVAARERARGGFHADRSRGARQWIDTLNPVRRRLLLDKTRR